MPPGDQFLWDGLWSAEEAALWLCAWLGLRFASAPMASLQCCMPLPPSPPLSISDSCCPSSLHWPCSSQHTTDGLVGKVWPPDRKNTEERDKTQLLYVDFLFVKTERPEASVFPVWWVVLKSGLPPDWRTESSLSLHPFPKLTFLSLVDAATTLHTCQVFPRLLLLLLLLS